LISALREDSHGAFDLPEGTVYPALHRLERDGLISSRWQDGSARRRRVYELTPDGLAALRRKDQEWGDFAAGMQRIVGRLRTQLAM
jgi:DNA-binding PadR family transcriptional regulator